MAIIGTSSSGGSYNVGSAKGQNFIQNARAGETMRGGDGSTWTKNSDGSTTINQRGTIYTVPGTPSRPSRPSSGSGTSGGSRPSSGGSSGGRNYVNVGKGGNAPEGTQIGDVVVTAGGNYRVVEPGTPGARYNPTNGLWSVKDTGGSSSGSSGAYQPMGSYNDYGVSANDRAAIESLQKAYDDAKARGDFVGMAQAHAQAQKIREKYGYSGGGDGSMYIPLEPEPDKIPQMGLPVYRPQTEVLNEVLDTALERSRAALKSALDKSLLQLDAQKAKLPALYQNQANLLAAEAEKQRQQFHELAAYNGQDAGSGSQAALAMSNQYQNNMGTLRTAEANALVDTEREIVALHNDYQAKVLEALAKNEYERAAALLDEYQKAEQSAVEVGQRQAALDLDIVGFNRDTNNRNYQRQVAVAEQLAKFGDFSGYKALGYTDDQVTNMRQNWAKLNPGLGSWG